MKNSLLAIFYFCFIGYAFSQNETNSLEQLKAPTAPAATIISIQPNEVVRPKSAKDLEAAIMTNYIGQGNSLNIPNNFMLEFMPYWLGNRKNIDVISEYFSDKWINTFKQNLSFSVASTQSYKIFDSINTHALGFGMRSLIVRGKTSSEKEELISKIIFSQTLKNIGVHLTVSIDATDNTGISTNQDFYQKLVEQYKNSEDYKELKSASKENVNALLNKINSQINGTFVDKETFEKILVPLFQKEGIKLREEYLSKYKDFQIKRYGLQIEVAGATSLNFPTNQFDFSVIPKWGLWTTFTFNPNEKTKGFFEKTSFVLMARYIRNDFDYYKKYLTPSPIFFQNNFDLGGRGVLQFDRFSTEIEIMSRYRTTVLSKTSNSDGTETILKKKDWEWKYMLNLNYVLTEKIVLSYSIGKQIEPTLSMNGNIISTVGLNFGFGGPKMETKKEE